VPQRSVVELQGIYSVMSVGADGTVAQLMVQPAERVDSLWRIASGLKGGERVIVEGLQKVRPGVKVKVIPDAPYEYFMLEDPLPAGCEVVKNTDGYTIPGEPDYDEKARQERGYYGWYWWYADRDVRDEKVSFFARYAWKQSYEFTYVMRAQIPGSYTVMPSVGSLMYYPEVRGNSASLAMNITE
jgi:uncharacterized protein YfaS (alpha-2-macroglobulin family)